LASAADFVKEVFGKNEDPGLYRWESGLAIGGAMNETRCRTDPVYGATARRRVRRAPAPETRSASFRASAICILLLNLAYVTPAMARGGHMHGMGGFGGHEGHGVDAGGGLLTPTYVLITVSKITDAEAFKGALRDLMAAETPFGGRVAMDTDKPIYWEGTAAEHVVMIQFDNPDQAQVWKSSDAFKSFDTELHRSSESTMQLVQGLPMPAVHGVGRGGRGRGFDQKAFEPNVKEYDQMLTKMHGICKGC
jgi:uncharacterized protein (DUF1330 family)